MKQYPEIPKQVIRKEKIYAFDKLDGSNIRTEWTKKKGFWKFGTRTRMLGRDDDLGEAIDLIHSTYFRDLDKIFKRNGFPKTICFFEYYGKTSFAGRHFAEPHEVTLIDIRPHKQGFLVARDFIKLTKNIKTAKLLYYGNCNQDIIKEVEEGTLNGMTFEGIVCKGRIFRPGQPLMFKVKSNAWKLKLKEYCDNDTELYKKLL